MDTPTLIPRPGPASPEQAEKLLRLCLMNAEVLAMYDGDLLPLDDDPAADARADQLRGLWGAWAREARATLDQLGRDPASQPTPLRDKLLCHIQLAEAHAEADHRELRRTYQHMRAGDRTDGRDFFDDELDLRPRAGRQADAAEDEG